MSNNQNKWHSYMLEQHRLELRESQLWWLAIVVIVFLTLAVGVMDVSNLIGFNWRESFAAFDSGAVRVTLILAVFLISAYFHDSARRLRRRNTELISDLRNQAELVERRNIELARLKDISDRLVGSLDMQDGLDLLLGTAVDILECDSATIVLVDNRTGLLDRLSVRKVPSSGGASEEFVRHRLAQWVVDHNQPVMVDSEVSTTELVELGGNDTESSLILAPIGVSGKALGVLALAGKKSGGQFSKDDLDTACSLTAQAGLALEKMGLYRKLQEQVVCLRSALHELTEAQAGLIQSEKLATVGQLAGGMAHEINNPLLTILGRAEILLMDVEPGSAQANDLEIIRSETQRIAGIVRNLLSFSRSSRTSFMSLIDVNEVLDRSLELVAMQEQTDNVQVIRRLSTVLPSVCAEKGEIQQVYMNIILNAYQAMKGSGGKLIVETSRDDSGFIVAKFADTGSGISPENMSHIFEPFFTTKPESEGTGLGLSVSRRIVEKYGGKIEVQNREGEGVTFIVKLPSAEEASADVPKAA